MNDLINRNEALKEIYNRYGTAYEWYLKHGISGKEIEMVLTSYAECHVVIKRIPSAEPKIGRWIRNDNGTYSCSVCQSWIPEEQHCYARYCLYCGAKMEVNE